MKIKLNGELKSLEGKVIEGTIQKHVANILGTEKSELDTVKAYVLAQNIYQGKEIDVEKDTLTLIRKAVEASKAVYVFAKAQILQEIDKQLKKYDK